MPRIVFTAHIKDIVPSGPIAVDGARVGDALERVFALHPRARSYIVDDQGRLRKHVAVFVDGALVRTDPLARAVNPETEIYVLQALSGG